MVGVKITPAFTVSGQHESEQWVAPTVSTKSGLKSFAASMAMRASAFSSKNESLFPESLLQHHSVRETQVVSLSMDYWKEVQVTLYSSELFFVISS